MTVSELMKLWVVEYSRQQGSFHVYEVEDMLANNLRLFRKPEGAPTPDFLVVGISDSRERADDIVADLRQELRNRE